MKSEKFNTIENKEALFEEINLGLFFKTLLREKKLISLITLSTSFVTALSTFFITPIYLGSFNIVVKNQSNNKNFFENSLPFSDRINLSSRDNTEKLILESPSVLKPVYTYIIDQYKEKNLKNKQLSFQAWINKELNIKFLDKSSVLKVEYKNSDKKFLLDVLNKISKEYQKYSKRNREEELDSTIIFLEKQKDIMKIKSMKSNKEYNSFTIANGLGNIDGFPSLDNNISFKNLNSRTKNDALNNISIQKNNSILQTESNNNAAQRYKKQFELLENYEASLLDLSSSLKSNSRTLKDLRAKIENLKSSLKRPNKILIKYRDLKNKAERDQRFFYEIEDQLEISNLQKVNIPKPWKMISIPTLADSRIFPNKKRITFIAFFISFILSSIIAFIREKKSGIIYDLENIKNNLDFKFIDTIYGYSLNMSKDLITQIITNSSSNKNKKIGILNFSSLSREDFLSLKKDEKINYEIIDISEIKLVSDFDKYFILIESGKLNNRDKIILNQLNKIIGEKFLGWFYVDLNINLK